MWRGSEKPCLALFLRSCTKSCLLLQLQPSNSLTQTRHSFAPCRSSTSHLGLRANDDDSIDDSVISVYGAPLCTTPLGHGSIFLQSYTVGTDVHVRENESNEHDCS